ncbi:iron-containing redox enzyme family protein [Trichocoleus sp. FACHB-262]|uniref:iron-containing redox enzyme family protein n=1 Tax=Trichocoleus sp. FACHB-262 TaxID=2692869 RepID=UPI0016890C80|nr:iron-containing redox enzyme family protein [Trichocoleus sp. FACHB-262]MBD2122269.1 iron-containing redox enzyme family protein [Trichocoleus sp. FACHB-262]
MLELPTKLPTLFPLVLPSPTLVCEDLIQFTTLDAAVAQVAAAYDFPHHPYFCWMIAPATSREAFCNSQLPFRFAVESFSQALAAVLARIPSLEMRLAIVENVAEEHGHGDRWRSHKYTFQQYLQALGATSTGLTKPCPTSVLAFNQAILNYCLTQPAEVGAAMLGMIEYLYVGISAAIARTLTQRAWVAPGSQSHYAVHEKLDTEHAHDLLQLASPGWQDARSRLSLAQALLLGAHYFWSLYADLLPSL